MSLPGATAAAGARPASFRWVMLGLVCGLYFTFGVMMASLAPLVSIVRPELGLSAAQMGAALGAWQLVFIPSALAAGLLIDRFGLRLTLACGTLFIALSALLRAQAVSFPTLFAAVAVLGIGAPTISVGVPKLVSLWFPPEERGGAIGLGNASSPLGMVASLAGTHGFLLPVLGNWRFLYLAYAAFAALLATVWFLVARDLAPSAGAAAQPSVSPFVTLRRLLQVRNVRLVLAGAIALFAMSHGMINWLPYVLESAGFSRGEAGYWAALSSLAGSLGLAAIPRFVSRQRRLLALACVSVALGISAIGIGLFTGGPLTAMTVLNGVTRTVPMAMWFLVLMETPGVGPRYMGAASGLFFVVAEVGGSSGPWLFGVLLEFTGGVAAGAMILAFLAFLLAPISLLMRLEPERRLEAADAAMTARSGND